ncbi:pyridoxamine 5'-phosphate oxidase family protein [Mycobacterium kansasii]|uniref:pyridoxamine 5'-phosphate oxidase family protein n=1 Tax=Mycobacterium kansasii TaxID=1768 RepID=UPI00190FFC51|nr:pyridoxamine 5'-phosphate oxidase family protein [Mycobacterium kansasii]GFP51829.1 hypothetical protein MKANGN_57070 [Mycobacterium kansasii]
MTPTQPAVQHAEAATSTLPITDETQVHRYRWLQRDSRAELSEMLDAGLIAHVGFVRDGKPMVIPMAYALVDGHLLMHGSTGAGLNRTAKQGVDLCATISICDGLVYAQNLFDSTLNYRCAVVFGKAMPVEGEEKASAIRAISERLMPGRWDEVESPTNRQMAATYILKLPLDQASLKVRAGSPDDPAVEGAWTGYVPMVTKLMDPVAQDGVTADLAASITPTIARFNEVAVRHLK